ncbi:Glycosyltransferase involved in cell wall bisynthesis [Desulfonatronum zhilinae]|nr:Glycosyltransferase involved in cell wall bisynthesis [Desulfonatronum zhilinae]
MKRSPDSSPLFSIIIPTYNQSQYLPHALESLISQTFGDWEALIVNDGSTDDTSLVAESSLRRDDRFRVFHKKNGGVASALNAGLSQATGDWICWLSSDDLFEPEKLRIHLDAIHKHPEIFFFYTHFYYLDDKTGVKSSPDPWNAIPDRGFQVSRFFTGPYIHGNSIAIHRKVFERIGYFDDSYPHGQDFEMWLRISSKYESMYINQRTCVTRWHASQTTHDFPEAGSFDSARALIEFINKHRFTELFPFLELNDPGQAVSAIIEAINISINNNSLIHKFGPSSAILDRLKEWMCDINDSYQRFLIKIVKSITNDKFVFENGHLKIREKLYRLQIDEKFSYKNSSFISHSTNYAQKLRNVGDIKKSDTIYNYLKFIKKIRNFQGKSNIEYWKNIQENLYFEKHHCYGKNYGGLALFGDDVDRIKKYTQLSKNMKVVVIGCGYGRESVLIAHHVEHVYGIDVSDTILHKAKIFAEKHGVRNFTPILVDKWNSLVPHDIDVVYCMVVFQHLTRDLVKDYIFGLAKKLSKNGVFVCQFADLIYGTDDAELKEYEPSVRWCKDDIISLVQEAGLYLYKIDTDEIPNEGHWHWTFFGKSATPFRENLELLDHKSNSPHANILNKKLKKILVFYGGLHNSNIEFAGTSRAMINLCKHLKMYKDIDISLSGKYIDYNESYDDLKFLKLPSSEHLQQFSDEFDVLLIATQMDIFATIKKQPHQKWFLHQHCWNIEPNMYEHMRIFDKVICLSDIHKFHLRSQSVPEGKLVVVPNIIDTSLFFPQTVDRDNYSIMFASAVVPHKCVHILIDAFKIIQNTCPQASLHIYGTESMWLVPEGYEKIIQSFESDKIHFYGSIANINMPSIYSSHSIYCLPSKLESFGMGTIEAQSCGCIPVIHNTGGVSATLLPGNTGFLYSPNTPQVLARRIVEVFNRLEADKSIRERAVQFVHHNFDPKKITKRFHKEIIECNNCGSQDDLFVDHKFDSYNRRISIHNTFCSNDVVSCNESLVNVDSSGIVKKNNENSHNKNSSSCATKQRSNCSKEYKNKIAPVFFLIYNRPDCTRHVFEQIRQAKPEKLLIVADGPRIGKDDDHALCASTRKIVENVDWDCDVSRNYSDTNLGCKIRVSSGISWAFTQVDEAIILEDDCLPAPSFFPFCTTLLDYYRNDERVFQINGTCYLNQLRLKESYFFSKYNHIWGWATWKRAWDCYQLENPGFEQDFSLLQFHTDQERAYWFKAFKNYFAGNVDTWDYPWTFSVWKNSGLCVYPAKNLIKNIGFGQDATHTKNANAFIPQKLENISKLIHPQKVQINNRLDRTSFEAVFLQNKNIKSHTQIQCPLTGSTNVCLQKTFKVDGIHAKYLKQFQIDVSSYFGAYQSIHLYKNNDTGFQFFYPFDTDGDSSFYEKLSRYPWYYMDWKWEHEVSKEFIKAGSHVLEIGCAKGGFLHQIKLQKNAHAVGLELNSEAAKIARDRGVQVFPQLLEQHAIGRKGIYNVVCSFQVIEHIFNVKNFINHALSVLKIGGKFIISVPNQDTFIGLDDFGILDMPPHHMNRWSENALRSLEVFFPLKLFSLQFEPLQEYHSNYFANIIRRKIRNDHHLHDKLINLSQRYPQQIRGHTVIAVYEKTSDENSFSR